MSDPLLRCEGIERTFYTGGKAQPVLRGVDLEIERGEVASLVGPSGSGKSTLIHILGLLDPPDAGRVWLEGRRIDNLPGREKARIRNGSLGFVFQFYHLVPELTALQNVLLSGMISAALPEWLVRRGKLKGRALELLDRLGMTPHLHKRPNKLSGGERQRVALGRALFASPPLIFCDEPTGNLDRETAREIMELVFEFNRERGTTFILVTHDEQVAAQARRKLRLEEGRIVDSGLPAGALGDIEIPKMEQDP